MYLVPLDSTRDNCYFHIHQIQHLLHNECGSILFLLLYTIVDLCNIRVITVLFLYYLLNGKDQNNFNKLKQHLHPFFVCILSTHLIKAALKYISFLAHRVPNSRVYNGNRNNHNVYKFYQKEMARDDKKLY